MKNTDITGLSPLAVLFVLTILTFTSCLSLKTRLIPMVNPATGRTVGPELRIPNNDQRLRSDCKMQGALDCLDNFWRLEVVEDERIVFRYRIIATSPEKARANSEYISRIRLVSSEGREIAPKLLDKFVVEKLPPLSYKDDGWVPTGRKVLRPRADGSVIAEDEVVPGVVTRQVERFSGSNYVAFEGKALILPKTEWVKFVFPKGLLGGGAEWTFHFGDVAVKNAEIAPERELPIH